MTPRPVGCILSPYTRTGQEGTVGYLFFCPGCGWPHAYTTVANPKQPGGPVWTFDGNLERPTFAPSLRVQKHVKGSGVPGTMETTCHLHVRDGQIQYCGDCKHQYSGQTIPMVEFHW